MKTKLECSKCGAEGEGSCDCGVAYMPKKMRKAVEAIKTNPEKSDRSIAAETGVSRAHIGRARKAGGPKNEPRASHSKNDPQEVPGGGGWRVGRDGKRYPPVSTKKRESVRPFTKDNGLTEIVNLAHWFDSIRAKLKERFNRVLKETAKTKKLSELTKLTLIDDINYLKQDLDGWIAQLDAIKLPEEGDETNVVRFKKKR